MRTRKEARMVRWTWIVLALLADTPEAFDRAIRTPGPRMIEIDMVSIGPFSHLRPGAIIEGQSDIAAAVSPGPYERRRLDHVAEATLDACETDHPASGRQHRVTDMGAEIDPRHRAAGVAQRQQLGLGLAQCGKARLDDRVRDNARLLGFTVLPP